MTIVAFMGMILIDALVEGALEFRAEAKVSRRKHMRKRK